MAKHLVLVGGGHAHLPVLTRLADFTRPGHRVTLIVPEDYHYYSGMGPGLLAGIYTPGQARFNVARMARAGGATVVYDSLVRIDPPSRLLHLASGAILDYDLVSFNTGSSVAITLPSDDACGVLPVKPIQHLLEARRRVLAGLRNGRMRLVVIGGGPSGVELCGALWRLARDAGGHGEIALVGGHRLCAGLPERVRELVLASLAERGVRILEGSRARGIAAGRVLLDDGDELPADLVLLALGVAPARFFAEAGLAVGDDGGLLVDDTLRSLSFPEIFGAGDCICLRNHALARVGVYAVRQGPVLRRNLLAALEDEAMSQFVPQQRYLQIFNLGDGRGLLLRGSLVLVGRWPFLLKDWIDRRFVARFQVAGEGGERWPGD